MFAMFYIGLSINFGMQLKTLTFAAVKGVYELCVGVGLVKSRCDFVLKSRKRSSFT